LGARWAWPRWLILPLKDATKLSYGTHTFGEQHTPNYPVQNIGLLFFVCFFTVGRLAGEESSMRNKTWEQVYVELLFMPVAPQFSNKYMAAGCTRTCCRKSKIHVDKELEGCITRWYVVRECEEPRSRCAIND
jgi:hypothetical protein